MYLEVTCGPKTGKIVWRPEVIQQYAGYYTQPITAREARRSLAKQGLRGKVATEWLNGLRAEYDADMAYLAKCEANPNGILVEV